MFNDGVGVVLFMTLFGIADGQQGVHVGEIARLFVMETLGGAVLGFVLGYLAFQGRRAG